MRLSSSILFPTFELVDHGSITQLHFFFFNTLFRLITLLRTMAHHRWHDSQSENESNSECTLFHDRTWYTNMTIDQKTKQLTVGTPSSSNWAYLGCVFFLLWWLSIFSARLNFYDHIIKIHCKACWIVMVLMTQVLCLDISLEISHLFLWPEITILQTRTL